MKHLKKFTAIALILVMTLCLASCSLVNSSNTDINNDNIKIGIILTADKEAKTGNSGLSVNAINELTSIGYGIKGERFKYVENIDAGNAEAVAGALKSLINMECSIIFATDPLYYDDVEKVADSNEKVKFVVYNHNGNGKNIYGYGANITGAAYLSGIAAGLKAAELKVPQLGFVLQSADKLSTLNAFAAGALSVNSAVRVEALVGGSNTEAAAEKLIKNGCVVLASDYEDEAIAKAAKNNDIFFCGFGTDTFSTGDYEDAFLCAPLYNFTQYYINAIKAVVDDTELKDFNGSYISGATYISGINGKIAAKGTTEAVEAAENTLTSGKLKIETSADKPNGNVTIIK